MIPKRRFSFRISEGLFLAFLLFSGVMLAFSSGGFVINFKNIGFSVLTAVQRGFSAGVNGVVSTVNAVGELRTLKKEYAELTKKLENYEQMQRTNADVRKENARLQELLDFTTSLEEKNYPARIISRDTGNVSSYITINKGRTAGIMKNMPVIAYQDGSSALVGKVVQVGAFTSIVMPLYNSECSVSVRIQNTRDLGLVTGFGREDLPLSMKYIKKRALPDLHYGDVVVTSGENSNYMRDLPVGTISRISVLDYDSSLLIELSPLVDFSRLENVVVVNMREINDARK